jgi:hypothetical protein
VPFLFPAIGVSRESADQYSSRLGPARPTGLPNIHPEPQRVHSRYGQSSFKRQSHLCPSMRQSPRRSRKWIAYRDAVYDQSSGRWVSRAEVAEIAYVAFAARPKAQQVPGRLVVRRIPELNPNGQDGLFDLWRYHAFFTTSSLDTVAADITHRGHAIIEQVHADLKNSALAHLPSGTFTANAAWLVLAVLAFNLTRGAAALSGPQLATATTGTIRRTLIVVPARIASSARRVVLHLPRAWPWQQAWTLLLRRACAPPGQGAT